MSSVAQRIRDPLHNLIEFSPSHFEQVMWRVIQTRPFQRLRRVKQLGLSELVYPGATHSRFAHSLGVFHTARQLMEKIREFEKDEFKSSRADVALAAALLHDVGHGPFSHAFEIVGKELSLKMAHHEAVSDEIIRNSEIGTILTNELGSGFANDVAEMIGNPVPKDVYGAVVSSQFDADRLDYMRRDRLMCGTQHGAIDYQWLLSNLEVGSIRTGVDEQPLGTMKTFVLGPKAIYAAETYILALFQLYPTVYYHKATRGAEKIFANLLIRVFTMVSDRQVSATGLNANHPLVRFAKSPSVETAQALDDFAFWGAIDAMAKSPNSAVSSLAMRLRDRNLFKAIEIYTDDVVAEAREAEDKDFLEKVKARMSEVLGPEPVDGDKAPTFLWDAPKRSPYRQLDKAKGPLNQIFIRMGDKDIQPVNNVSPIIGAIRDFEGLRIYVGRQDTEMVAKVTEAKKEALRFARCGHAA